MNTSPKPPPTTDLESRVSALELTKEMQREPLRQLVDSIKLLEKELAELKERLRVWESRF